MSRCAFMRSGSIDLALRLRVITEGVETGDQSRLLKQLGCDEIQCYLFSKPVPFVQIARLLGDDRDGA